MSSLVVSFLATLEARNFSNILLKIVPIELINSVGIGENFLI